jgi:glycerol uptake operon antiterminator
LLKEILWRRQTAGYDHGAKVLGNAVKSFEALLRQSRIIPAVRNPELLPKAAAAPGKIVYLLCGTPENIGEMAAAIVACGKTPIVNLDLISGLARDAAAIEFLSHRGLRGIISTHQVPLRAARSLGLFAIQRTFLLDSAALESSMRSIAQTRVDAVEVLPALVAPLLVSELKQAGASSPPVPVIAGGLVQSLAQIQQLIDQGVNSVSVGDPDFWVASGGSEHAAR